MQRKTLQRLIVLCICAAVATACASDPEDNGPALKAAFAKGLKFYDAGNYPDAYKTWKSIDEYDLAAMRNVAIMLREGKGVAKDPKAAEAMMQRAAEAGLFTAQADLGDMLLKGEAGPPNPSAAAPWLMLAAQAGHPMAEFELGQLYEQGIAVKKDIEIARKLYKAALAGGVTEAGARLDALPPEPPVLRLNGSGS
ncbi:MAG: sel1 repeat family protein [Alphaproteobacteria bacterium]|nr:sel1 repeat family protein [Alphaproteobacteria bacterium]MDE1986496.1 sel1 repeat family protein [Alphaproteobacteria bacterium]MDE2163494.1 sel1 repeat family protein [Alphaproteobacteria bacterium]MDE2267230.1 sel1 repeat family protein [Alphaproteobacteria bacterium]MDE2499798.1 sel1 repeat family protein [Alphaproteobacteria bacterium]